MLKMICSVNAKTLRNLLLAQAQKEIGDDVEHGTRLDWDRTEFKMVDPDGDEILVRDEWIDVAVGIDVVIPYFSTINEEESAI